MRSGIIEKLVSTALEIEEAEAIKAGQLGYMARILVQITMPHSKQEKSFFERSNGALNLAITGHPKIGLPYGVYPRLLLAWLVTEAVRHKTKTIILGPSLSEFMHTLGLVPTGGRWGNVWRLRDQIKRLFSASITCSYQDQNSSSGINFNVAKEYNLWWDPKNPEQNDIWESQVVLSSDFFEEIISRPVPIDMRALNVMKDSSMAIDLYCWLTYRLSYLDKKTEIPWVLLQKQFGANYANTKQGKYQFKRKLKVQLKKVISIYHEANIGEGKTGLILSLSKPHIRARNTLTM